MLIHFFKSTMRNLFKHKMLTGINILGLTIGIACFSLFLLYAINEFNYDEFHLNAKNIYRVYKSIQVEAGKPFEADVILPMPLGPAMKQDFQDVKNFIRTREAWQDDFIKVEGNVQRASVSYTDSPFFEVFSFKLKSGDPATALKNLNDVVLAEGTAKRLYGAINPVGKTILIKVQDTFDPFVITAVAEDAPSNSSLSFEILANFEYLTKTRGGARSVNNWNRSSYITYVQLIEGSTLHMEPKRLQSFYSKYNPEKDPGSVKSEGGERVPPITYGLQPLLSMHTDVRIAGGNMGGNASIDPKNIKLLLLIAGVVLLIACINFTTLAIGRSAGRAKEVGIRKVVGSSKRALINQFIVEALFLSALSTGLGLMLGKYILPYFNQLSGRSLTFSFTQFPQFTIWLMGLIVAVGLIAGSYPAIVLSGFKPIEVFKQKFKVGGANVFTRSLVTFQFVISIGLIASTAIMLQQIHYMTSRNPGFTKNNVVVVNFDDVDTKKVAPLFKQFAVQQSKINGIAGSELGIGEGTGWSRSAFDYNGDHKEVYEYFVDPEFIPLLNIPILAGRNFDIQHADDTLTSIVVNEAMVADMGWTLDNAVGQVLNGYYEDPGAKLPIVIGVVKNFNFRPLREEIRPQLFHQFQSYVPNKYFVRLKPGDPSSTLKALETAWKSLVPDLPFRYTFLDEDLDRFYKTEQRWGNIIGWAGSISIFLACLGLFGLAALAAINRTREIGIRKVLGASIPEIISLISTDFIKLIFIALVIASPIVWYIMHLWLQGFAFRIDMSWMVMFGAGLSTMVIALITVSVQGLKAASVNPVKSLRSE